MTDMRLPGVAALVSRVANVTVPDGLRFVVSLRVDGADLVVEDFDQLGEEVQEALHSLE